MIELERDHQCDCGLRLMSLTVPIPPGAPSVLATVDGGLFVCPDCSTRLPERAGFRTRWFRVDGAGNREELAPV